MAAPRPPVEELRERLGPAFNARYMSIDKPPKDEDPVRIYARHTESVLQSDGPYTDSAKLDPPAHPSFRVDPDFVQDVVSDGHTSAYDGARMNLKAVFDGKASGKSKKLRKSSSSLRKELPWTRLRERDGTSAAATTQQGSQHENVHRQRRHDDNKKPWGCESRMEWLDLGEDRFPRYLRTVRCKGESCWFTHFQCKGRAFTVNVLRRVTAQPACEGGTRLGRELAPRPSREVDLRRAGGHVLLRLHRPSE
ncbi:hypothetical protein MTO96_003154 [Rhipicephalus appendiculatus]